MIFFSLGLQSFGGGSSTFILIHQACLSRGWLTEDDFVRTWALAQISPGINLVKLTVLIGHKLRGWPGLVATVAGLLLPSAVVTVLMTAGFAAIRNQPQVKAAMKGVLPATIGLSFAMAIQMAQPLLKQGYLEGPARLSACVLVLVVAALMLALAGISPVLVLLAAGGMTVLILGLVPARRADPVKEDGL